MIPIGLFVAVFAGATIMSITNTGFYYTPTEDELPTQTMIDQANALPETKVFLEKYPESKPLVDRASSFGVHYQAYPRVDSPIDTNFDSDGVTPYVALVVPFTDDKVVGNPYIYCVQNYVRSERIYEEDNSRFYKVQSHEGIINYLQNKSCFLTEDMVSKDIIQSGTPILLSSNFGQ